jgi:hypothetical protein
MIDKKAKLLQTIQEGRAALDEAIVQHEARARMHRRGPDSDKPIAQQIAELKASALDGEAILRGFTPETRQGEGGIAAGKLASTMERVGMVLEGFDSIARATQDGAARLRAIAEECPDQAARAGLEGIAHLLGLRYETHSCHVIPCSATKSFFNSRVSRLEEGDARSRGLRSLECVLWATIRLVLTSRS